jgi:hypothetical protein
VIGVRQPSTLCQWEKGVAVPRGAPCDRLRDLLDGKLWVELRQAMIAGSGMPERWSGRLLVPTSFARAGHASDRREGSGRDHGPAAGNRLNRRLR